MGVGTGRVLEGGGRGGGGGLRFCVCIKARKLISRIRDGLLWALKIVFLPSCVLWEGERETELNPPF